MSGTMDADMFSRSYSFLEGVEEEEIKSVKAKIKACGVKGKKGQRDRKRLNVRVEDAPDLQNHLKSLLTRKGERQRADVARSAKKAVNKKINAHVAAGGKRYYLKRRELKAAEAEAKFDELRKRGKGAVRKALERRRIKNSQKDKRKMPPKKKGV